MRMTIRNALLIAVCLILYGLSFMLLSLGDGLLTIGNIALDAIDTEDDP